tara:strand:- start:51 stop:371 length:321 start_codon:yes stop_codon:yes gene_type:complete
MADFTSVTRGLGSFVSRTKSIDKSDINTTALVKRVTAEIYEPTGSNYSTSFMIASGSSDMHKIAYMSASLVGGGKIDGKGLAVGEMHDIALSYVSASTHVVVDLYR